MKNFVLYKNKLELHELKYKNSEMPWCTTFKNVLKASMKFCNITARQHNQAYLNAVSPSMLTEKSEKDTRKKTMKLFSWAFVMSGDW